MIDKNGFLIGCATALITLSLSAMGQRQMEYLDRGLIALPDEKGGVFLSWRLLGDEPADTGFDLYRIYEEEPAVKMNTSHLIQSTTFIDRKVDLSRNPRYFVRTGTQDQSKSVVVWENSFLEISLQTPEGYRPNDASAGDLTGDGRYELVVHMTGKSRDNSQDGFTDPPILHAYTLDGTLLWEINLGINIREGAHYTQFIVYDLDGDGVAEVSCKTADGSRDGLGTVIGDGSKDWRNQAGKILDGPEYLTVFSGNTGQALSTVAYIPDRGDLCGWGGEGGNAGNDCNGNRVDRFLAGVGYLDGKKPSLLMARGYYGRSVIAAWDFDGETLRSRWVFDSEGRENPFSGQGNHSLSVNDVDGDGRDEMVYGAMVVEDDGSGRYSTGLRHGDALHVSRFHPDYPDQVVWGIHENETNESGFGVALFNARTGGILWGAEEGRDVGRGLAADIDPRHEGAEFWWNGSGGLYNFKGEEIGKKPGSINFALWWDGDLLRELLDKNRIDKWDYEAERLCNLLTATGCAANNGSKATPALSADLFGDWREEVVFRTEDNQSLRIYTSREATSYRFPTLMHNPQYRLGIAWQNVGYNQPPHTDFYLGEGMEAPKWPKIAIVKKSK
ncbi:rhamnogalacturonan endolyase [Cyclobacterium xiamenense]|uniref:Rhamnogalacturonan endolyase n=1 Tax=Cyclobacterium xiamenense TaxID=1297121 RepID=A0A1H6TQU6_9BACT|nr:rhamnogalacturonan lyase [Cyclobacterium xiamenense]SEI78630.1 rhamnogalacturonan endolyase [Cyclobacterium xiamenense]